MKSHTAQIATALAAGAKIDERWLHQRHIRNQHKRLEKICLWLYYTIPETLMGTKKYSDTIKYPFWPIENIGSPDGHPVKYNGRTTRCGVYYLPAKYRKYLRKVIKQKATRYPNGLMRYQRNSPTITDSSNYKRGEPIMPANKIDTNLIPPSRRNANRTLAKRLGYVI